MEIKTRVPGMVQEIFVKPGDQVKIKDVVAKMEAMKMVQSILSPVEGEVVEVMVEQGERVRGGAVLMVIEWKTPVLKSLSTFCHLDGPDISKFPYKL